MKPSTAVDTELKRGLHSGRHEIGVRGMRGDAGIDSNAEQTEMMSTTNKEEASTRSPVVSKSS